MRVILGIILTIFLFNTASARLTYDALIRSARIYLSQTPKDFKKAQEKLQQAIESFPEKPPVEAYVLLGEIHATNQRYAEMVKNFDLADSICSNTTDKKVKKRCKKDRVASRVLGVRNSMWIEEFNEGAQNMTEAKEMMDEMEETEFEDEDDKLDYIEDVEATFRLAMTNFTNSTIIQPDSTGGWIDLGICYYHLSTIYGLIDTTGEFNPNALKDSAIQSYSKVLEVEPDNFGILSNMATIYFELEDWDKCAETYGKMAALQDDNVSVLQNLVMFLLQLRMDDSARVVIDRAIELDPDNAKMHIHRGYMGVADGAEINDSINKLKADNEKAYKAEIDKLTKERNKTYSLVVEDFSKVVEIEPSNFDAWYYLGMCHYFLENYEKSRDSWEKAVEVKPDAAEIYELLAPLYLKLGDRAKSMEAQKKAEELQGKSD